MTHRRVAHSLTNFLLGMILSFLGAGMALAFVVIQDAVQLSLDVPPPLRLAACLVLLFTPGVWRSTVLYRRGRPSEASYTLVGTLIAGLVLIFAAMAFIAWAIGSAMPRG